MRKAALIILLTSACGVTAQDRVQKVGDGYPHAALSLCLKETAAQFAAECKGAGCEPGRLSGTIGLAQRTHCGYTESEGKSLQPIPPEPLLKCLRQTAADATLACDKGGCFPNSVFFIIGAAQKIRCKYTAFEPMELPPATQPVSR